MSLRLLIDCMCVPSLLLLSPPSCHCLCLALPLWIHCVQVMLLHFLLLPWNLLCLLYFLPLSFLLYFPLPSPLPPPLLFLPLSLSSSLLPPPLPHPKEVVPLVQCSSSPLLHQYPCCQFQWMSLRGVWFLEVWPLPQSLVLHRLQEV